MSVCCCGYNPALSNVFSLVQGGLAIGNGVINGIAAKRNGATNLQAASYGLATTSIGFGNALMGNAIDKYTHSYLGTTMSALSPYYGGFYGGFYGPSVFVSPYAYNPFMYGGFYGGYNSMLNTRNLCGFTCWC